MNHQINIDEAIAIAKEYHLEAGKFIYLVIDKSEDTQN